MLLISQPHWDNLNTEELGLKKDHPLSCSFEFPCFTGASHASLYQLALIFPSPLLLSLADPWTRRIGHSIFYTIRLAVGEVKTNHAWTELHLTC